MTVIFVVLPLAIVFSGIAVGAFLWCTCSGQLDDLETPPLRALRDAPVRREATGYEPPARDADGPTAATILPE